MMSIISDNLRILIKDQKLKIFHSPRFIKGIEYSYGEKISCNQRKKKCNHRLTRSTTTKYWRVCKLSEEAYSTVKIENLLIFRIFWKESLIPALLVYGEHTRRYYTCFLFVSQGNYFVDFLSWEINLSEWTNFFDPTFSACSSWVENLLKRVNWLKRWTFYVFAFLSLPLNHLDLLWVNESQIQSKRILKVFFLSDAGVIQYPREVACCE